MKFFYQWSILLFLVVGFSYTVKSGVSSASSKEQAKVIAKNAQALRQGLEFFHADFERFPQALEFQNPGLMQNYFSVFPPKNFTSKICGESYMYKRPSLSSFEINFCLPAGAEGYAKGWNKLAGASNP